MKKLIMLFAMFTFALVSCNSGETKEGVKTDSTAVCVDTTKAVVDTVAKMDTCKKVEQPIPAERPVPIVKK